MRCDLRLRTACTCLGLAWALGALSGCAGGSPAATAPVPGAGAPPSDLPAVLAQLDALAAPAGVKDATFSQLKYALRQVLQGGGRRRFAAAAPLSAASRVTDLRVYSTGGGTARCGWTYANQGDYDQNSEVNISDLTPIGLHLGKSVAAADWVLAAVADGDSNGEVNIADVTPIGQNLLTAVSAYRLEWSATGEADGTWEEVAEIAFAESAASGTGGPRRFTHVLAGPVVGRFYRVVPFLGDERGIEGVAWQYTGEPLPLYEVRGTCLDDQGEPLPDVVLALSGFAPALSDAGGGFAFTGVEGGYTGELAPQLEGFSFIPPRRVVHVAEADVVGQDFAWRGLPVYSVHISQADIDYLEEALWDADYRTGDVTIDGSLHEGVGLRYRGGSAMLFPKKSWKVKFNDGDQYPDPDWGYKRGSLNLNAEYCDATLMREKLSYDLMQDMGLLAPRARFVRLYVNDVYQGLYTDVENPRRDWLKEFGLNNKGSLYQAQGSNLTELPYPEDYAGVFEKELREDEPYDDLAAFISALNSWAPGDVQARYHEWLDTEQLTQLMAAYCVISMADHIETNYFLYHDFHGTGRWIIFPWDHDRTWGHQYDPEEGYFSLKIVYDTPLDYGRFDSEWGGGVWGNVLYDRYLNDPQFFAEYKSAVGALLAGYFAEAPAIERIDGYERLIRRAVLEDTRKWGDNADYPTRVDELREYVQLRRAFLLDQLAQ